MRSKSMRMRMRSNKKSMKGGRRNKRYTTRKHRRNPRHVHSEYMMHGGGSPPPWVGSPYNAADLNPSGNFLPLSDKYGVPSGLPVPPVNSNPQFGGRRRSNSRVKKQRGGGLSDFISTILPDDIVNIGRSIPAAIGHTMDRFNGLIPSASSQVYPTQQPIINQTQAAMGAIKPPDISGAYGRAVSAVQTS